mmetsp:Transcript_9618/g.21773  ORF Transcript_9618/g.21773 Transcript_9618/m.21773 type:complete len:221 (-) Transcript_9618:953-1615(-)
MMRQETRVESDVIRAFDMVFAVPDLPGPLSSWCTPGRKRSSFTSFVKRPARAPSRAVRAARMTTVLSKFRGMLLATMEWSNGTDRSPTMSIQKKNELMYVFGVPMLCKASSATKSTRTIMRMPSNEPLSSMSATIHRSGKNSTTSKAANMASWNRLCLLIRRHSNWNLVNFSLWRNRMIGALNLPYFLSKSMPSIILSLVTPFCGLRFIMALLDSENRLV